MVLPFCSVILLAFLILISVLKRKTSVDPTRSSVVHEESLRLAGSDSVQYNLKIFSFDEFQSISEMA